MAMTADEAVAAILTNVKTVSSTTVSDAILTIYITKVVDDVLSYCHRDDFPDRLVYTVMDLMIKRLGDEADTSTVGLKSIKMDDTEFQFNTNAVSAIGCMSDADFDSIRSKLNLYRKMVRPCSTIS